MTLILDIYSRAINIKFVFFFINFYGICRGLKTCLINDKDFPSIPMEK